MTSKQSLNNVARVAYVFIAALACGLLLSCGNKDGAKDGGQVVALTPVAAPTQACANGVPYAGQWDGVPLAQMNVVPYGYGMPAQNIGPQVFSQQGYCGCPSGTTAMCDGSYGLVCVPVQYLGGHNIAWWNPGASGFAFSGYAGYAGYGNVYQQYHATHYEPSYRRHRRARPVPVQQSYGAAASSCATQIGQTCAVGQQSCGDRSYCQPMTPGASVGVCAR